VTTGESVALVTGSSKGIGRAIATRLAEEGYRVAINSSSSTGQGRLVAAEIGRRVPCGYFGCDVADPTAVRTMLERVRSTLGPVGVVVNNAGWMHMGRFEHSSAPEWDQTLRTKVVGALAVVQNSLEDLKEARPGRKVNVTGDSGRVGNSRAAVHSAAQGAHIALTKSWGPRVRRVRHSGQCGVSRSNLDRPITGI